MSASGETKGDEYWRNTLGANFFLARRISSSLVDGVVLQREADISSRCGSRRAPCVEPGNSYLTWQR